MAKIQIYNRFNLPPKVETKLDTETCFVSQDEVMTSSLAYQVKRFGMDSLEVRMADMQSKFGYADCTKTGDFAKLQNEYVKAKDYFENLPADVRRQYQDRADVFYEEVAKNPEEAVKHGFLDKEQFEKYKEQITQADNTVINIQTNEPSEASGSIANEPSDTV